MKLDASHPWNRPVLGYLRGAEKIRFRPEPIAAPESHPDPYMEAGSHPDIVERLWDDLGSALPADSRALIFGAPALVHPEAGVVLALAFGTQYAIRVPFESLEDALGAGCHLEQEWTDGGRTNIEQELGRGWVFGCWATDESIWLSQLYAELGRSVDPASA